MESLLLLRGAGRAGIIVASTNAGCGDGSVRDNGTVMSSVQEDRWRRPARIIPLALVGIALIGIVGYWAAAKTGLKRELEAIRAKGWPTNPAELDAWYAAVPAEENVALKLVAAGEAYVEPGKGDGIDEIPWGDLARGERFESNLVTAVEGHLEENAEALRLLRESAALKRSRYATDLSKAPEIKFDHLLPVKRVAQLARAEAVFRAERGDAAGTIEALGMGSAISHSLAAEPLLISELVRIACVAIYMTGLERAVSMVEFDEVQLSTLGGMVRQMIDDCGTALPRALIGERAFANTGRKLDFEEYEQMMGVGAVTGAMFGTGSAHITAEWPEILRKMFYYTRRGVGMFDRDHAYYMRSLGKLIEATEKKHPEMLSGSEDVAVETSLEMSKHPIAHEMSRISLPVMFTVPKRETLLVARLRCAEAALEIERWRQKNGGRSPKREDLSTAVFERMPVDPVDGKPLKFEVQEKGYRIVAAAAAALEKEGGVRPNAPDIGFEVRR